MKGAQRPIAVLAALTLIGAFVQRPGSLHAEAASALVTVQKGDLPIIISSPHGGTQPVPGVPERMVGGAGKFVKLRDGDTDVLASRIAEEIEKIMGARPHLVIARFHRKFIDANRPVAGAYESAAAKPHFDAYHDALDAARLDVRDRWGSGILIDIHGQGTDQNAIFRGTINGKSVQGLLAKFGKRAIAGPDSIAGQLAARGHKVLPPCDDPEARETQWVGGHILATHAVGTGVDGVQLEFGRSFRKSDTLNATAKDVAGAVAVFAKAFLPAETRTPDPKPVGPKPPVP